MANELWYIILFEFYALAFLGIRSYQVWISRKHKITSPKKSLLDHILVVFVLLIFYFCMIYYPLFPNGTIVVKSSNIDIFRMLGVIVTLLSLLLLLVAAKTLSTNWSPIEGTYDDHQLITTGIYCLIRHPIYAALLCFTIGMSLIAADLVILVLLILPHTWLILQRIPREESLLIDKFGDEYREYMNHTKRLIPFIY
ncbi:MAG: methyltransferase family protein [Candidatus Hodarchaeales archaeon]|jgi:protein-S-isoprenylcysteine O-methyltransferase Ste14